MTLDDYLRQEHARSGAIDFRIRADVGSTPVRFYIHPMGKDGDTRDFMVLGDVIVQDPHVTRTETGNAE